MAIPRYHFSLLRQTEDNAVCNHAAAKDSAEIEIDDLQKTGVLMIPLGKSKNRSMATRTVGRSDTVPPSSLVDDREELDGILMVPLGTSKNAASPPARTVGGSSKNGPSSSPGCEYA
jgi:hypothetical protein